MNCIILQTGYSTKQDTPHTEELAMHKGSSSNGPDSTENADKVRTRGPSDVASAVPYVLIHLSA